MERRLSLRVAWGVPVEVHVGPERVAADLMNVSLRGMFLRGNLTSPRDALLLASAMTTGCSVALQLELQGRDAPLEAVGSVAWRSDLGVGVDFHQLSSELAAFIERLSHDPEAVPDLLAGLMSPPVIVVRESSL